MTDVAEPDTAQLPATLVDTVRRRAQETPEDVALRFLVPGTDSDSDTYTTVSCGLLDNRAAAVAASLCGRTTPGDRVLVVLPPGPDFLAVLLGCLYAGTVAVPLPVPDHGAMDQFCLVGRDADVTVVLTAGELLPRLRDHWSTSDTPVVTWLAAEDCAGDTAAFSARAITTPDDLALLLYTSGSTGNPKGVAVGYAELAATLRLFAERTALPSGGHVVNWIPLTHALGLGMVLLALHVGGTATVLAPADFFADPLRWLRAISDAGAPVLAGGPPIGYERCAAAVATSDSACLATLDLSRWLVALIGAERIRPQVLRQFDDACGPLGFPGQAWFPAYGLTETMLIVTGHRGGAPLRVTADAARLEVGELAAVAPGDRAQVFIGCGTPGTGAGVMTVDPATRRIVTPGQVGEIWIAGPVVMRGYWRRSGETAATFHATLADGSGPFLRTGDLGFRHDDELVVCGRLKELIIIRGRNLYPQDIEQTCRSAHPAVRGCPTAAFSVDGDGGERLVVVAATDVPDGPTDLGEVAEALRAAVTVAHDVEPHEVVLVRPAKIQLTASGKVKRGACRQDYVNSALDPVVVARRRPADEQITGSDVRPLRDVLRGLAAEPRRVVIAAELRHRVASAVGVAAEAVRDDVSVVSMGLDSLRAMELRGALHRDIGVLLPLGDFVGRTVAELAGAMADADPLTSSAAPAPLISRTPDIAVDEEHRCDPFPLTELQHAYFAGRDPAFALGGVSTHFFAEFDSTPGPGTVGRLRRALESMVRRHDMLRAVVEIDGTQRVLPPGQTGPVPLPNYDLSRASHDAIDAHLAQIRAEMSHDVLPLGQWPLFDIRATTLPGGRLRVHVGLDLLLFDVWSLRLFFREWGELVADPAAERPAPRIGFRDYVRACAARSADGEAVAAADYWRGRLPTLLPGPELPVVTAPESVGAPRFRRLQHRLAAPRWRRIRDRAAELGVTPSSVLLAAYATALGGWNRTSRFTLTIPTFNRLPLHADIEQVIGDFTSVTLLDVDLTGAPGLGELARRIQHRLWQDLEHRRHSGVQVLRELARQHGSAGGLFAPIVFASARGQARDGDADLPVSWLGEWVHGISQTPQVLLDHQVWEDDDGLTFNWDHVDGVFHPGVVDDVFAAYSALLYELSDDGDCWARPPRSLLPRAQRDLLAAANDTAGPIPEGLLHGPIVREARRAPDRVAVVAHDGQLTYGRLYASACGVAHRLRDNGIGRGGIVGVCAPKGCAQLVAALGVLLAGGAYLPIDPELPVERQDYLVDHAGAAIVLGTADRREHPWPSGVRWLDINRGDPRETPPAETVLPEQVQSTTDVAYVIYTSGSTGLPKGVAVSHRAALNTCVDMSERFGVGPDDVVLGLSSLSFDLSVYDVFGVLGVGGTVVLPAPGTSRDPAHWLDLVVRHGVTVWNSVPALMGMFAEYVAGVASSVPMLRLVLLSGDWIPVELPDVIRRVAPGAGVVGLGGATEAAIWSIHYPIGVVDPGWESVPYGFPLRNQSFHVFNDRWQECPVHVAGELFIGGVGLAECYWRDADRTAASFVEHPVSGERLYRTGDLGRRRPDGAIEFLGREDFQVKIGGFRIELGEIESVLGRHDGVRAVVAAAVGDRHHRRLVGYVVPEGERDPAGDDALISAVRRHAETRLPAYMVPPTILVLDELPLSANGKVDRSQLDGLSSPTAATSVTPPAGQLEKTILAAVKRYSGRQDGGVLDNFFDLGIDSLTITKIYRDLRTELNLDFPITDMFGQPNVRRLAEHLGTPGERPDSARAGHERALARRAARARR